MNKKEIWTIVALVIFAIVLMIFCFISIKEEKNKINTLMYYGVCVDKLVTFDRGGKPYYYLIYEYKGEIKNIPVDYKNYYKAEVTP